MTKQSSLTNAPPAPQDNSEGMYDQAKLIGQRTAGSSVGTKGPSDVARHGGFCHYYSFISGRHHYKCRHSQATSQVTAGMSSLSLLIKKYTGPASILDDVCLATAMSTPANAKKLKLPNLEKSRLSISNAGGGLTAGLHNTRVQTNNVT